MLNLSKVLVQLHAAPTWTERIYLVSPLLLAALQDVSVSTGVALRRDRRIATETYVQIGKKNATVMSELKEKDGALFVRHGPFSGIKYSSASMGSLLGAKIFGTYESEISGWFSQAMQDDGYDTFVDVGCAEGYYAVGMAVRCPRLTVFAYDIDETARCLATDLARLNDVNDRVSVAGFCSASDLQGVLSKAPRPLLLVDIEGYEDVLLDPSLVPAVTRSDIIVELHEHKRPGVTYRILDRFSSSHHIDAIAAMPDEWKISQIQPPMDRETILNIVQEGRRRPQLWLRMLSHSSVGDKKSRCL
jgi:hypothetical protein